MFVGYLTPVDGREQRWGLTKLTYEQRILFSALFSAEYN